MISTGRDYTLANKADLSTTIHVSPFTNATDFNTVAINLQKEIHRRRYVRNANWYYNEITNKLNATGMASAPALVRTPVQVAMYNRADVTVQVMKVGYTGTNRTWVQPIALAYTLSNALKFCVAISADMQRDIQAHSDNPNQNPIRSGNGLGHDSSVDTYTGMKFRYRGRIPAQFLQEFTNKTNALASKRMSGVPGANHIASKRSQILNPDSGPSGVENHGCDTSCTGFCSGSCINFCNGCTGCTATCGYGCGWGCNSTCQAGSSICTGDCGGSCSGHCKGSCTSSCGNNCSATCSIDCTGVCRGGCGTNCSGTCADSAGAITTVGYAIGGAQQW